jgi:cytochrome P450
MVHLCWEERKKTPLELADELLFLSIGSIHSTCASTLSTIYNLLERPDVLAEIWKEFEAVNLTKKEAYWSKHDLDKLEKMDSFMKESQRISPLGLSKFLLLPPAPFFSSLLLLLLHTPRSLSIY